MRSSVRSTLGRRTKFKAEHDCSHQLSDHRSRAGRTLAAVRAAPLGRARKIPPSGTIIHGYDSPPIISPRSQNSAIAIGRAASLSPEKRVAAQGTGTYGTFPLGNVGMPRRRAVNETLPYCDMRRLALLTREKIGQKRLLTEIDQLLRNSHD